VHGNVWEWTEDCWNDSNNGNPGNGSARATGNCIRRVLRSGSWGNYPWDLRSAFRNWGTTVSRDNDLGFRVGRTLSKPEP
jgi:formylglycine-generating enzyme required for sulfatase activity